MIRLNALLVVVLLLVALLMAVGASVAGPTNGAFLNDPASSVSQVITQVEQNRLVALRYAKHFGTDPSSVLDYMRMELDVRTLDKNTSVDVYYIDSLRNIAKKSIVLNAGTKVFANNSGLPILEYESGNPLTDQLSTIGDLKELANPQNTATAGTTASTLGQSPAAAQPSATSEAARSENPTSPTLASTLSSDQPVTNGSLPVSSGVASLTSKASPKGASISSLLIPLGIIGGAVAILSGGHGASGTNDSRNKPDPVPVPEPAGLMVLGSGMMAFAGYAFRRRRA